MAIKLQAKQRLAAAMFISFAFFATELAVAYKTQSLALMADSFHYMNDLLSFSVALGAILISEQKKSPQWLTFGWQRAQTLGAFFNGIFLLALGLSIFFQSIERFIAIRKVDNVKLILIMGCVGLVLNIISAAFLHENHGHDHSHRHEPNSTHSHGLGEHIKSTGQQHQIQEIFETGKTDMDSDTSSTDDTSTEKNVVVDSETISIQAPDQHDGHHHPMYGSIQPPTRDIGMMGVMIHVIGDAINNLGIIIASLFIWFLSSETKYYADPAVSVGISFMIFITAIPLVKTSGAILLQGAPPGLDLGYVKHDLERIPGIESVHELHVWRLDQRKTVASAHVIFSNDSIEDFTARANTVRECLHAYGIHSVTLQPELGVSSPSASTCCLRSTESCGTLAAEAEVGVRLRRCSSLRLDRSRCRVACGNGGCEHLTCCAEGKL